MSLCAIHNLLLPCVECALDAPQPESAAQDDRESGFNKCCFKSLCLENARELKMAQQSNGQLMDSLNAAHIRELAAQRPSEKVQRGVKGDTPRTDALISDPMTERETTMFLHARRLERELAEQQISWQADVNELAAARRVADELRAAQSARGALVPLVEEYLVSRGLEFSVAGTAIEAFATWVDLRRVDGGSASKGQE